MFALGRRFFFVIMKIIITKNYSELSAVAADFVIKQIKHKPNSVLGLPTGSTPLGLYGLLIKANQAKKVNFSKVKTFNLDEYYNLDPSNRQSYHYFMNKNLFSKINIDNKNVFIPRGDMAKSEIKKTCADYENQIKKAGGIDLQVLGLGSNGHIGFNEPGSSFKSKTRLVNLTKKTIKDNSRFFKSETEVPKQAISMGLATIVKAKKIIVIVSGQGKADAAKTLINQPASIYFPASILKKHRDVTIIIDKSAASKI